MSNETKWTPGPWEASGCHVIYAPDGWPLARVDEDRPGDEEEATEYLMAAAPDLYEALAMAEESPELQGGEWHQLAVSALAKARGEA